MNLSSSDQLGFGFDALPPSDMSVSPPAAAAARKRKSLPTLPVTPAGWPDAEGVARQLEQHPDYRVLRRLQPSLAFPRQAPGPRVRLLVLDSETTGLNPARDKLVELAMLRFDVDLSTGQPVGPLEVYGGLDDPGMPMPGEAQAITGISDEMLRGQRLDEARIATMLDGVDLVLAHNAGFDRPFVEARLPQFALVDWACSFAGIDWKLEGRSSAKLSSLAMELGWFYDAHRAEMDCHALLAVLSPALPVSPETGLLRLIHSAQLPFYRLQASAAPFEAKELLKARGYRWDSVNKVWHIGLAGRPAFEAECGWLKAAVYAGRPARLQFEQHDARTQYSTRAGRLGWQEL